MQIRSSGPHGALVLAFLGALTVASFTGCGDDPQQADQAGASATGAGGASSTSSASASVGTGGGGGAGGGVSKVTPEIKFVDLGMPMDLTPDGAIALIQDATSLAGDTYFYNTRTGELALKTQVGDATKDLATGISATLRISAMHGVPVFAGIFSEADGWRDLVSPYPAGCDPDLAGAFDLSADGKVAVGILWNGCHAEAFRWVDTGGKSALTPLEIIGSSGNGAPTNRATVISDDGKITAGFAESGALDRTPARWTEDGKGKLLDPSNLDTPGEVLSISADGASLAGITGYDGFRWTEAGGYVPLERLATSLPSDKTFPNAIAASGELIFGGVGDAFSGVPVAFVWTAAAGSRSLQDLVVANGLVVPEGYALTNVLAASADGTILLGLVSTPTLGSKSFVLKLPVEAYGLAP
jgi:hypothetical protein